MVVIPDLNNVIPVANALIPFIPVTDAINARMFGPNEGLK
jgi:hypothetical protein